MSMAAKTSLVEAWRKPRPVLPQSQVAVIAPSGPVPQNRFLPGLACLSQRYRVAHSDGLLSESGFLAGDDGRRLAELRWALSDPLMAAVFCARGGHGALRLVPWLAPLGPDDLPCKPFVGFSDATVLHAFLGLQKRVTIHGPGVTQLAELSWTDRAALWSLLEQDTPPGPCSFLQTFASRSLRVTGRLLGGNLEMLSRLCGTPLFRLFADSGKIVLLLEEVTEAPYRIDRALSQLRLAGAFQHVVAVVVGDFVRCEGPPTHPTATEVLVEHFVRLGIPLFLGLPLGHGKNNLAVPLGVAVSIDTRRGQLEFLEAAVERFPDSTPG